MAVVFHPMLDGFGVVSTKFIHQSSWFGTIRASGFDHNHQPNKLKGWRWFSTNETSLLEFLVIDTQGPHTVFNFTEQPCVDFLGVGPSNGWLIDRAEVGTGNQKTFPLHQNVAGTLKLFFIDLVLHDRLSIYIYIYMVSLHVGSKSIVVRKSIVVQSVASILVSALTRSLVLSDCMNICQNHFKGWLSKRT